jgi:hypothetical protein
MEGPDNTQELSRDQREIADRLLRNFLVVIAVAFAAEVLFRVLPSFLGSAAERRWLEWLLVSLVGVCVYLLWNVAVWYRENKADFKAYRPWYRATAAKGPVVALIVLLALTSTKFQVGVGSTLNVGIDFGQASDTVLLIAAFLLGFYSRLAMNLLGRITGYLFGSAYEETYPEDKNGTRGPKDGKN